MCLSGGIRGIRGYSITGNTQSLHLCIGSSNLPTSITSMNLAKIDRVLGKDLLSQDSYVYSIISLFNRPYNSVKIRTGHW